MSGDLLFSDVTILCPFEVDGLSVTPDDIGYYGYSDYYSSEEGRFTGAAMYADGTSDYWSARNSDLLPSGLMDFTVEGWTKIDAWYNSINTVCDVSYDTTSGFRLSVLNDETIRLELLNEFHSIVHPSTRGLDVWFHWAITRESGAFRLWIDGVGSTEYSSAHELSASNYIYLGAPRWSTSSDELRGYWSELRVTLNHARYTEDFTPPSEPFPRYGDVIQGVITDDAGAFAERTVRLYDRSTGDLVGAATSDPATGVYTLPMPGGVSEYQIVCLDDDAGATYEDIIARYSP